MAAGHGRLHLLMLVLYGLSIPTNVAGICDGKVSDKIYKYAKQHFKRNWEAVSPAQVNTYESNVQGHSFVYLPHEVILQKNAISNAGQRQLFSKFFSSLSQDKDKTDQSLCNKERCVLFTWTLHDTEHTYFQDIGSDLFMKTAKKLKAFQTVKPGSSIEMPLKPEIQGPPKFSAIHGVWYNESGYLQSHRDKTWTNREQNESSQADTEWVLSISLGASALFTYYHPKDDGKLHGTTVIMESGDVLLFNGAYLYHGVSVIQNSTPRWVKELFPEVTGRLNLQYRVLKNPGNVYVYQYVFTLSLITLRWLPTVSYQ